MAFSVSDTVGKMLALPVPVPEALRVVDALPLPATPEREVEGVTEGLAPRVAEAVGDAVLQLLALLLPAAVPLLLLPPVPVMEMELVKETLAVLEGLPAPTVTDAVLLLEGEGEGVAAVPLPEAEVTAEAVAPGLRAGVSDADEVLLTALLTVALALALPEEVPLALS